ncbi:UNVERIFIED_CONTAM: hypothetical protein RMT77_013351 [Armadillidium vulgare]
MEEETIVINDLLSFVWCKIETCPKDVLLTSIQNFYPYHFATEALNSLLTAIPNDKKYDADPYEAIIECIENTPNEQLPTFVCRNVNNIPDVDKVMKELSDSCHQHEELYQEHEKLASDIKILNNSLLTLSKKLHLLSGRKVNVKRIEPKDMIETINLTQLEKYKEKGKMLDATKQIELEKVKRETLDSIDDSVQINEELGVGILANRYQRALARSAEKGTVITKVKKFKPIVFDSKPTTPQTKTEIIFRADTSGIIPPTKDSLDFSKNSSIGIHQANDQQRVTIKSFTQVEANGGPQFESSVQDLNIFSVLSDGSLQANIEVPCDPDPFTNVPSGQEVKVKTDSPRPQYPCPLCSNVFLEENWINHVRWCHGEDGTKDPTDIRCRVCNVFFADRKILGNHMGYHNTARQFGCSECGYRFFTEKALEGHKKLHSPLCKNRCPFCPFRTFRAGRVKQHVRSHTGERPYECKICDFATTSSEILRGHIRSHTLSKELFKCTKCDKCYTSKYKLNTHEQMHEMEMKEKKLQSAIGSKISNKYLSQISPDISQNVANILYSCAECPFKNKDKSVVREHLRETHINKIMLSCTKPEFETGEEVV